MASSLFSLLPILLLSPFISAVEFRVGGLSGWKPPTGDESETFNNWAARNRFHVGDSLYFKYYKGDSVLVVDGAAYARCDSTSFLLWLNDGSTTVRLDRHGFFYFISGASGHCQTSQKLFVRVLAHIVPVPAPEPAKPDPSRPGSDDRFGPSGQAWASGSSCAAAAAPFVTPAVAFFVLQIRLYLFLFNALK